MKEKHVAQHAALTACCAHTASVGPAAPAGKKEDKLSVIAGNLGSTGGAGSGAFSDTSSGDDNELDFDKWQVR